MIAGFLNVLVSRSSDYAKFLKKFKMWNLCFVLQITKRVFLSFSMFVHSLYLWCFVSRKITNKCIKFLSDNRDNNNITKFWEILIALVQVNDFFFFNLIFFSLFFLFQSCSLFKSKEFWKTVCQGRLFKTSNVLYCFYILVLQIYGKNTLGIKIFWIRPCERKKCNR